MFYYFIFVHSNFLNAPAKYKLKNTVYLICILCVVVFVMCIIFSFFDNKDKIMTTIFYLHSLWPKYPPFF